jgi:hypothetical protein
MQITSAPDPAAGVLTRDATKGAARVAPLSFPAMKSPPRNFQDLTTTPTLVPFGSFTYRTPSLRDQFSGAADQENA